MANRTLRRSYLAWPHHLVYRERRGYWGEDNYQVLLGRPARRIAVRYSKRGAHAAPEWRHVLQALGVVVLTLLVVLWIGERP